MQSEYNATKTANLTLSASSAASGLVTINVTATFAGASPQECAPTQFQAGSGSDTFTVAIASSSAGLNVSGGPPSKTPAPGVAPMLALVALAALLHDSRRRRG